MKRKSHLLLTCAAAVWMATTLGASTAVGVYAIVDRVTIEPTASAPERIRIDGVFVVPIPVSSGLHAPPKRGYLYFSRLPDLERSVRRDWSALQAAAGSGLVVGFGEYWVRVMTPGAPNDNLHTSLVVHVHPAGSAAAPEAYPIPLKRGIVTSFDDEAPPRFGEPSSTIVASLLRAHRR